MTPTRLKEIKDLREKVGFNSNGFTITLTNALDVGSILNAVPELIEALEKAKANNFSDRQAWIKTFKTLENFNKQIEILRRGLEHYESAHYNFSGTPCSHDNTATKTLAEADEVGK